MMKGVQSTPPQRNPTLSIPQALDRIKGRLSESVPADLIEQLCRDLGHRWRDLGPVVATHLFRQQVLHGSTAIAHLRPLSGLDITDAAYCQARPGYSKSPNREIGVPRDARRTRRRAPCAPNRIEA